MTAEKISAIGLIIAGALIALFAKTVCRKTKNVPGMQRLGVSLVLVGALLLFLP